MNTDVEAKVTDVTENGVKVVADWPLVWCQAPKGADFVRKLELNEIFENPTGATRQGEYSFPNSQFRNVEIGDRVVVRCHY
jgi:hypothetical protein